jgi:pyruvate formate-lyase activating enzyme-like uncharacterized protein
MPTRTFRIVKDVYAIVGDLPQGCKLCMQGGKVVIFITGLCDEKCFYCPVSRDKLGFDKVFADEEPAHNLDELLDEIDAIGAEGASITGGDPLVKIDRTVYVIKSLKEYYGPNFHIHLYTSGLYATSDTLLALERSGLDEIRFHIVREQLALERIAKAVKILKNVDVGVEIPMLPDRVEWVKRLILKLEELGVKFINLNELEVSPTNINALLMRGYRISKEKPVVEGSEEAALEVIKWAYREGLNINVHYCPARYKDRIQLRVRLLRKALRIAKPYEKITSDGMLEVLEANAADVETLVEEGVGELTKNGKALLHPVAARARGVKGVLRRFYPLLRRSRFELPLEEKGIS